MKFGSINIVMIQKKVLSLLFLSCAIFITLYLGQLAAALTDNCFLIAYENKKISKFNQPVPCYVSALTANVMK